MMSSLRLCGGVRAWAGTEGRGGWVGAGPEGRGGWGWRGRGAWGERGQQSGETPQLPALLLRAAGRAHLAPVPAGSVLHRGSQPLGLTPGHASVSEVLRWGPRAAP